LILEILHRGSTRKFPSKTCSAEPGPMDRAASAKIAGYAVDPPSRLSRVPAPRNQKREN
mgnify:CR=1